MGDQPNELTLTHRLRSAFLNEGERPVSFILGSGVSSGAAPTTAEMVDLFKKSIATDPEDARDLSALLDATQDRDHYQAAAQFVVERVGISRLNRVVRLAVMSARSPKIPSAMAPSYLDDAARLQELDDDWRGWSIPRGLTSLGRLLDLVPPESRGMILTTNFDPLIEASLRAASLVPHRVIADIDGSIPPAPALPNLVTVSHLHGYWSQGDTLHTGAQLTRPRPRLLGSLRQVLTRTTCVVLGYAGWDDLLTESILTLVEEGHERDIEILWGSYGPKPLLGALTGRNLPGRLQPYVNVDVNSLFPAVEAAVRSRVSPGPRKAISEQSRPPEVTGFEDVTPEYIERQLARDTSPISAISYFDGRSPTWVDALGSRAARLDMTSKIELMLANPISVAYLLAGPTGEGKSTMLRQTAGKLAEDPGNRILWLSAPGGFEPRSIVALPHTTARVWVVIDDADIFAKDISAMVFEIDRLQRGDIHLLLAARDGDWNRATQLQSATMPSRLLTTLKVGGITLNDAAQITQSWAQFGDRALGKLGSRSKRERAEVLYEASKGNSEGALLGALLATRYGNDFRQHIWELMKRLSNVVIPGGKSLLEVYGAICLMHRYEISPLSLSHLSIWLGISETEVDGLVVYRLGREAAAERHGDSILPRHRRIAEEVVDLLPEFGISATHLLGAIVSSVVEGASGARWKDDILSIVYAGQRLESKDLAIAAADGAVQGDARQLRLVNYRVGVYREFDEIGRASEISEDAWRRVDQFNDLKLTLRKFLITWARVEGKAGRYGDAAALNASALLDIPEMGTLSADEATRALSGIAWSLGMLPDSQRHSTGRGACAESALYLAPLNELREQANRYLGDAMTDGYSELSAEKQRAAILSTVRESLKSSKIGPARRFGVRAVGLQQLFAVAKI